MAPWGNLHRSELELLARGAEVHYWPQGRRVTPPQLHDETTRLSSPTLEPASLLIVRKGRMNGRYRLGQTTGEQQLIAGSHVLFGAPGGANNPLLWLDLEAQEETLAYVLRVGAITELTEAIAGLKSILCAETCFYDAISIGSNLAEPLLGTDILLSLPASVKIGGELSILEALQQWQGSGRLAAVTCAPPWLLLGGNQVASWVASGTISEHAPASSIMVEVPLVGPETPVMEAACQLAVSESPWLLVRVDSGPPRLLGCAELLSAWPDSGADAAVTLLGAVAKGTMPKWSSGAFLRLTRSRPWAAAGLACRLHDLIAQRALADFARQHGPAPCDYALIAVGATGAEQILPPLRQEHVLIWSDGLPAHADSWFSQAAEVVCGALERAGFVVPAAGPLSCRGGWRKPLATWNGYLAHWAAGSPEQCAAALAPFVTMRIVAGSRQLYAAFRDGVDAVAGAPPVMQARLERLGAACGMDPCRFPGDAKADPLLAPEFLAGVVRDLFAAAREVSDLNAALANSLGVGGEAAGLSALGDSWLNQLWSSCWRVGSELWSLGAGAMAEPTDGWAGGHISVAEVSSEFRWLLHCAEQKLAACISVLRDRAALGDVGLVGQQEGRRLPNE